MRPSGRLRQRSVKVRADADILMEGSGDDYGWVSNYAMVGGTLGDYDPGGSRPSWWLGEDVFDGRPVGPNGPGVGGGYGQDPRGGWRDRSWWNRPSQQMGFLPAVTRCTTVIVNPIVRTPWQVYDANGPWSSLPLWLRDPTLRGSTPGQFTVPMMPWAARRSSHEFWQTVLTHAIWWGLGAFVCQEDSEGRPLAGTLQILNPYMLEDIGGYWVIDPNGDNPIQTDFDGKFQLAGQTFRIYAMRGLPPNDGHTPEGVLARHFETLRLGASIQTYQRGQFGNGVPPGFLKVTQPNFGEDKAAELKKAWMEAHGGSKNSIAVLNAMVDFTPISRKPVDNETTALKHSHLVDVAHAFGLSASWLDTSAGASLTYSNITEKRKELLDISLTGFGQQFMEMLNACLAYGTGVRIMWDRFTNPDLIAQATVLTQAVQAGWLTADEARERVGMEPLAGATNNALGVQQ